MDPKAKPLPITRSDIWLDPLCCREAQDWLEDQNSCAAAWSRCFNPSFVCWFLDFFQARIPDFASIEPSSSGLFTRRPWRMILYRDFFHYEMGFPPFLVSLFLFYIRKNKKFSLWVFWLVVGYFDGQRDAKIPPFWWNYTTTDIKALYQAARGFLSEVD